MFDSLSSLQAIRIFLSTFDLQDQRSVVKLLLQDMRTFYLTLVSTLGFFMALLALSLQYKHFLRVLLSLEAATINLFVILFAMSNNITFSGQTSLILITLGACEASLGLAILVAIIRSQGNDYVSRFSSQKC